jgi:hypothetical protein
MLLIGNKMEIIKDVKAQLSFEFYVKYLGVENLSLGMEIKIDWENMKLWLDHRNYVETILQKFNMKKCKSIKVLISICVHLSMDQHPKTQE